MRNTLPFQEVVPFIRKKKRIFIKHTKNIPFPEARKIVESYIGTKTYANVAQKVNQPPQQSTSIDKYQKLIEKLINLKAKECIQLKQNKANLV